MQFQWNQANAILAQQSQKGKRTGRKAVYLLSGLVACDCGKTMYIVQSSGTYRCKDCRRGVTVADIDEIFQMYFREYLQTINAKTFHSESKQLRQLDDSIPELQAEVDFLSIQLASSDTVLAEAQELSKEWEGMMFEKRRGIVETKPARSSWVTRTSAYACASFPLPSKMQRIIDATSAIHRSGKHEAGSIIYA